MLAPGRFGFNQREAAGQGTTPYRFIRAQIFRNVCRLRVELLGGKPCAALWAHEVAVACAAYPVPALRRDQAEPGAAKARIGDDDRRALRVRQQCFDALYKLAVHLFRGQMLARMHFFIEREAASVDNDGRAQPVHRMSAVRPDPSITISRCGKPLSHACASAP